jgi:hypothetical protein
MRRLGFLCWVVSPKEFTHKIVEGGVCRLEDISKDMRNRAGRTIDSLEATPCFGLRIVVSLGGKPDVLWIDVLDDYVIEDVEMMECPL